MFRFSKLPGCGTLKRGAVIVSMHFARFQNHDGSLTAGMRCAKMQGTLRATSAVRSYGRKGPSTGAKGGFWDEA